MSSQESSATASSASTNNNSRTRLSSGPATAPILSPASASSKRLRLSADFSTSTTRAAGGRYRSSSSSAAASPYVGSPAGGASSTRPTGYRRNLGPTDLTPIDAPTQRRNYVFDSKTSRKDLPPSVTKTYKGKRTSEQASLPSRDAINGSSGSSSPVRATPAGGMDIDLEGDEDQDDNDDDDDDEKKELFKHVEQKRRANTIAARKSRKRKAEFIEGLKTEIEDLKQQNGVLADENALLRKRAEDAEHQLSRVLGLTFVPGAGVAAAAN